jgi:hypothetical protein
MSSRSRWAKKQDLISKEPRKTALSMFSPQRHDNRLQCLPWCEHWAACKCAEESHAPHEHLHSACWWLDLVTNQMAVQGIGPQPAGCWAVLHYWPVPSPRAAHSYSQQLWSIKLPKKSKVRFLQISGHNVVIN